MTTPIIRLILIFNKMNKLISFSVFILLGLYTSKASKVAVYNIPLIRVEVSGDTLNNEIVQLSSGTDELCRSQFEDGKIQIIWKCNGTRFMFVLLNKTNSPLTIDWDKIIFVDTEGEAGNVIHSGVKYIDRNNGQLKTIVPKMAKLNDFLIPSKNCVFNNGSYFRPASWQENYLFPCVYKKSSDLKKDAPNLIGKTMRVEMPLFIDGEEQIYSFYFELNELMND